MTRKSETKLFSTAFVLNVFSHAEKSEGTGNQFYDHEILSQSSKPISEHVPNPNHIFTNSRQIRSVTFGPQLSNRLSSRMTNLPRISSNISCAISSVYGVQNNGLDQRNSNLISHCESVLLPPIKKTTEGESTKHDEEDEYSDTDDQKEKQPFYITKNFKKIVRQILKSFHNCWQFFETVW